MKVWLCLSAAVMLGGCVAAGYGDGDVGVGVGYVGGFYDPCCYSYGGWGHGYRVGPPHGYARGPVGPGVGHHPAPSIPHGVGGAHGGGGHGGGHH